MRSAHRVLVAAPGMTLREVATASNAKFRMPRDDAERGIVQPRKPCRLVIRHPFLGLLLPPGLYVVADAHRGRLYRVMSTPQLDHLGLEETIELIRLVGARIGGTSWEPVETPACDALRAGLPERSAAVLGAWRSASWAAELRVKQDLVAGSEEARVAGFPEGGFLTSLTVWDDDLRP